MGSLTGHRGMGKVPMNNTVRYMENTCNARINAYIKDLSLRSLGGVGLFGNAARRQEIDLS